MTDTAVNMDMICAQRGFELVKEIDKDKGKILTDGLSVLEEQGVYALFLYLLMKKENKAILFLQEFLREWIMGSEDKLVDSTEDRAKNSCDAQAMQKFLAPIGGNLDKLLQAHGLLRQMLVYARYHGKCE